PRSRTPQKTGPWNRKSASTATPPVSESCVRSFLASFTPSGEITLVACLPQRQTRSEYHDQLSRELRVPERLAEQLIDPLPPVPERLRMDAQHRCHRRSGIPVFEPNKKGFGKDLPRVRGLPKQRPQNVLHHIATQLRFGVQPQHR